MESRICGKLRMFFPDGTPWGIKREPLFRGTAGVRN